MSNGDIFRFDMRGFQAMYNRLDGIIEEMDQRLAQTLTRLALHVISDAKKLAPLDEGDLEAALNVDRVKATIAGMYIEMGTSPEVDHYAVRMHEDFYTPGEKTASKASHGGFEPGRKYLENAIKMNEALIVRELQKALYMG